MDNRNTDHESRIRNLEIGQAKQNGMIKIIMWVAGILWGIIAYVLQTLIGFHIGKGS